MNPLAALAALALAAWGSPTSRSCRGGARSASRSRRGWALVLRVAAVAALLLNWAYLLAAGR